MQEGGKHVNLSLQQSAFTVLSGNSQSAEQENRCGRAGKGERGGHAETPGKLTSSPPVKVVTKYSE